MKKHTHLFALMFLALSACSEMGMDWLGGGEKEVPLAGERVSLEKETPQILADKVAAELKIILPEMPANAAWPQALGNATGVSGNLAFSAEPVLQASAEIGEAVAFNSPLVPAPLVAEGMVFAMDGAGNISAHHVTDIKKIYWKSAALLAEEEEEEDEEGTLLGGGLAWANHTLFASNDQGVIVALSTTDGKKRWKKELKLPLRSPPRLAGRYILILTSDNQLITLMQSSGEMVWSHRGMSEVAGKLHDTPPAVRDGMVVVTYSSGEIAGLDLATGNPIWVDNLAGTGPNSADPSSFTTTSPLMAAGLSFAGSSQSVTALESETGRRLWERRVPALSAPWLAGNYLFLQTPSSQLVAIRGVDGLMPWITPLTRKAGSKIINWRGPVVAGGSLWLVNDQGVLAAFDPQTGSERYQTSLPDDIVTTPIIADKAMYLVDEEANLHLVK